MRLGIPMQGSRASRETHVPSEADTSAASVVPDFDAVAQELSKGRAISIIRLVEELLKKAHGMRASDVHIDPRETQVCVRFRIDGVLKDVYVFPLDLHSEVISRIKILTGLRTDEHNAAQDGRFRLSLEGIKIDVRVSVMPTYFGENAVLRLLADTSADHTLEILGFGEADRGKILSAIQKTNGMILATGPTGSGKTTTLYTLVKMLNTPEISIVTIEDPIEYAIPNVKQVQVNSRTGLTFATGLRSMLRQDPNIIMVGEIRDSETAGIAVNTALTGHLLLSTLHTNDAATTLPRLLDMGIDGYLVASTIRIAIGQRLVRKICQNCKKRVEVTDALAHSLSRFSLFEEFHAGDLVFRGSGCDQCSGSGYAGRICINEVFVADADIREAILRRASSAELRAIARKSGMTTMMDDGFSKVRAGETTLEDVLRAVYE